MTTREVQTYFRNLAFAKKREVARAVKEAAEELRNAIAPHAPRGATGNTQRSVRVTRTRNELTFVVRAGGQLTSRAVREGSGVAYDYALAGEFGTSRQPAQPWFYPAGRAAQDGIEAALADEILEILTNE